MAINNEKQFKKWLKEQMVEGERRFTDNSISAYLSAIRSAESKLSVASVFSCRTLSEFDALDSTISEDNLLDVNTGSRFLNLNTTYSEVLDFLHFLISSE